MIDEKESARMTAEGIAAVESGEYLRGLNIFIDLYRGSSGTPATALSHYGLCLALVEKNFDLGAELCLRAIEIQPDNADHHANLGRLLVAANRRAEAVDAVEQGLYIDPQHPRLRELRDELGYRSEPPVPFLSRSNPINRTLGRSRHARRVLEQSGIEAAEHDDET